MKPIDDSERLAALKKHLAVTCIDAWEKDALLVIRSGDRGCNTIYFQSEVFTIDSALDWLVMEERRKNAKES